MHNPADHMELQSTALEVISELLERGFHDDFIFRDNCMCCI